uniref:Uncharacterized protein n=1 Tax=Cajanus cajan TaxID=3821 RepID=A0A151RY98_CAJCA|nr:hypothetical protein KK1_030860 [Cajanus cajan]
MLVDGGATINIRPKTLLKRLGKDMSNLKPLNILISDYANKSYDLNGMIILDVQVVSVRRMTMFIMVSSNVNSNVLLRKEWIHEVGVVPSILH